MRGPAPAPTRRSTLARPRARPSGLRPMQPAQFRRENDRLATVVRMLTLPEPDRLSLAAEYQARSEAAFAPSTKRVLRQVVAAFQA